VLVRVADGTLGWREEAPFDAVIVTAGAPSIPEAIVDQVALGGRIVLPVGDAFSQTLQKGIRSETGIQWQDLGGCVFVKLVGQQGWPGGS
jgi:protein-L-isoaspartate(D-aspartate) O-methyltransferase